MLDKSAIYLTLKAERGYGRGNMFLKLSGSILIIIASTYLGFYYGKRLIKRIYELTELERLGTVLENEIVYSRTPFPQAIYSISFRRGNEIENLFYKIYERLSRNETDSIYQAFILGIDESSRQLSIEENDIKLLLDFAKSLGDYDIDGYKKVFAIYKIGIKNKIIEAENKKNKNLKMYRYLGFSIGAMAVIMII